MKTITQLYPLFFLIIYLSGTAESEDNTLINDDLGGVLYKIEEHLKVKNYKISNENYNACTYNNGKDPNIRKNIEEIIKVLVKDSLPLAMETLDEQEHDIARDIQVAANKIIIQLALHASNITRKILQSMEKPNNSQVVMNTEMHNEFIVPIYQYQIKKIAELENKLSLLSNNTEKLTDTINVNNKQQNESIAIINNKIIVLENLTSTDSHEHKDMMGTVEKIQNSVMNLSETCQKVEEIATRITSFCDVKLPVSIVPNPNIWKNGQIPEKDYLDTYMIYNTGCSYLALESGKEHELSAGYYPGQMEWRVAVRAREYALMRLVWDSRDKYSFWVGANSNTESGLNDHVHRQYPERDTPRALAEDRYVPLYIKINNGKLTAGAECESEPWFTVDFPAAKRQEIIRRVYSGSNYGAKVLYDCPASFTGQ